MMSDELVPSPLSTLHCPSVDHTLPDRVAQFLGEKSFALAIGATCRPIKAGVGYSAGALRVDTSGPLVFRGPLVFWAYSGDTILVLTR